MINNQKESKPYFDPYIYKKVLEDTWLPPVAKEILRPWCVTHKHKFLFPGTKERFKSFLLEEEKHIESIVDEELAYQLSKMLEYIGSGEEEKLRWFNELKEEFNLPHDYKFE